MSVDLRRMQSVFLAALEVSTPNERTALLDQECGGDGELRRWVAELLRTHDRPVNALDTPVISLGTQLNGAAEAPLADDAELGTVLAGRYRLIERIGRGGMGTVYRAEQTAPVRRTVAIKVIRPELASPSTLSRFASERQALALMDHPNIAKVFDAGTMGEATTAGDSRPFFVMEYVNGVPFTKYCVSKNLTLRERFELFLPVCLAVEHAHQRGIIHRDLKPGNVLVTEREPQSKRLKLLAYELRSLGA